MGAEATADTAIGIDIGLCFGIFHFHFARDIKGACVWFTIRIREKDRPLNRTFFKTEHTVDTPLFLDTGHTKGLFFNGSVLGKGLRRTGLHAFETRLLPGIAATPLRVEDRCADVLDIQAQIQLLQRLGWAYLNTVPAPDAIGAEICSSTHPGRTQVGFGGCSQGEAAAKP